MESSIAEFLERQLACELLPTAYHENILHYYMPNTTQTLDNTPCSALGVKTSQMASNPISITAFISQRTNLSPFTKGCREWDASM